MYHVIPIEYSRFMESFLHSFVFTNSYCVS
jgi:hypothetical protein